ncbi:response regulator [Deinococcus maricopensis]|uniref:Response regulator receiver protein n=1 Tax=Deinococcus maricopensis (strain DSM 21211 / LMG 22137 / NRRL B-23946 / LB-34) TaxID=709986 RepID=E8UB23_DEIML|nr:response regulator [Deinococcus maricopensis]ADV68262.1 response regulator receiver protein [Deinococcus maricopensis DSM 21211]
MIRAPTILLVEDYPLDVMMFEEALRIAGLSVDLKIARDGEEAQQFIAAGSVPDLIVLDLNLPRMDGFELLQEWKSRTPTRTIPIAVLSTSEADADVQRAYDLQANVYMVKPTGHQQLHDMADALKRFWFQVVKLPNQLGPYAAFSQ